MKNQFIVEEIKWCKANRGMKSEEFEDGFIAGLKQALRLLKSRPTQRVAACACAIPMPCVDNYALCSECRLPITPHS